MDSADGSAGVNFTVSEYEKIMAALTSFGSTLDTHGQVLNSQRESLDSHAQLLQQYGNAIQQLANQATGATNAQPVPTQPAPTQPVPNQPAQNQANPTPTNSGPEPRLPAPERYGGKPGECRGFLTQCDLTFELQSSTFATERAKIAYVITLLTDKARAWATSVWQRQGPECSDFKKFSEEMLRVFDQSVSSTDSAKKLMNIRQGKGSVSDYAIAFRTLAAVSGWNDAALVVAFHHGLSDSVKDGLASAGCPSDLETLITHAMRLDNRLRERRRDQIPGQNHSTTPGHSWSPAPLSLDTPEPMQIGRTSISATERERRRREKCCIYCGKPDHFRASCPELLGKDQARPAEGGF